MTSDTARLSVMNLNGCDGSNLGPFDVEEVDVMSQYVNTGKYQHGVGTLSVEPDGLVEWQELKLGSDEAHQISTHG